jgi:hypothetical protein
MLHTKAVEKVKIHLKVRLSFPTIASQFITSAWLRKMFYGAQELRNCYTDCCDVTDCSAKLHVWRRPTAQRQTPYMKTAVPSIVAGDTKALLCNTQYFYRQLTCSWITFRMHCCISTATVVTRKRQYITSYVHCISCFYFLPHSALQSVCLFFYNFLSSPSHSSRHDAANRIAQ